MKPNFSISSTLFLVFFTLFLYSSCTKSPDKKSVVTTEKSVEPETNPAPDTTTTTPDTTNTPKEAETPDDTNTSTPPSTGSKGTSNRSVDEERLSVILDLIAQDLEAQKLEYKSELGQDCPGIYHKIKDLVQKKMSELGDNSKYMYPTYQGERSSRQIADWYYRNGNLHIVQNAKADGNLIRPGSVMFYGRTEEKYSNLTIDLLTNPGKFVHDGTNGKIMHIATVTKVYKDENGNVTKYTIMHGRNSRNVASRTAGNHDGPSHQKVFGKFPYGNWNQQWVAVANIETPKQ